MIRRRELITLLGGAAAAWPLAAGAQVAGKVRRIGVLTVQSRQTFSVLYAGFLQGMRDLGYVEDRDFTTEFRSSEGDYARLPDLAAELVRLNVDVLITGVIAAALALQQATRTIPIVIAGMINPVGNGIIASLARPGGNTTGTASSSDDTLPKQLELLTAVVSNPSRIGFLTNPGNPTAPTLFKHAQGIAQKVGMVFVQADARNRQEIESAFEIFAKERAQAVMIPTDAIFTEQRQHVVELAMRGRLPSISPDLDFAAAGGLMSYGENRSEFYRRAATFVHKLMHGAKPADLPVEQPTRFHLVINRKTADVLGLTIPALLYIFADEVIE